MPNFMRQVLHSGDGDREDEGVVRRVMNERCVGVKEVENWLSDCPEAHDRHGDAELDNERYLDPLAGDLRGPGTDSIADKDTEYAALK